MERQKMIQSSLTVKLSVIGASIITTFITFLTETKPISANNSSLKVLVRENNLSTSIEEISGEPFSINASELVANLHNERLNINGSNIDVSRYVNIEISERGCDVASYLAISAANIRASLDASASYYFNIRASLDASASYSFSLLNLNTPANITMSVTTPTRGRRIVKLESIDPELQKTCNKLINSTIEIHNSLNITILKVHQPVQESELELTIQNTWNTFNQQY
jgi:hypothetical protein